MIAISVCIILLSLFFGVILVITGKNLYFKIQATSICSTLVILLITSYGFLTNRPHFLDLAIIYALLNIIGMVAILKFLKIGNLGSQEEGENKNYD